MITGSDRTRPSQSSPQITPAMLHILLAVAAGARHGYGIMREIARRTGGATELGAATLYRSVRKMLDAGWLEELDSGAANPLGPRRRTYALTRLGRQIAAAEVRQLDGIVRWARASRVLGSGEP